MRILALSLLVRCILAVVPCLAPSLAAAKPPPPPFSSCVNLSNALEAPIEGHWGYTIRAEDIKRIAEAGFDAIRVPIRWSAHTEASPPHLIDPALFKRVDEVVAQGLSAGLKVIINVHHFEAFSSEPSRHAPQLAAMWEQISKHYTSAPDDVIFELINEPNDQATAQFMNRINQLLVTVIRETNPKRWIIFGGAQWGSLGGLLESLPPKARRVIASFHYYDPFSFTHQGATFVEPMQPAGKPWGTNAEHRSIANDMKRAAAYGETHGVPVLLGEFGVHITTKLEDRAHWLGHVRAGAEENGIGWCHWGWAAEFRMFDAENDVWIAPIRDALIRPNLEQN